MKKNLLVLLLSLISLFNCMQLHADNLPTIELFGKKYYCYEVKKGDTLYGISKKFGWEQSTILEVNPSIATNLKKDTKIYYPVGEVKEKIKKTDDLQPNVVEPVEHLVKKGETVYSISRQYGVSVDDIYALNPSSCHGIKAGEKLVIKQADIDLSDTNEKVIFYTVKKGDTLYSVSKQYNSTIESLLNLNQGIDEDHFQAGAVIKIAVNSNAENTKEEKITERKIEGFKSYKVEKEDTWQSIASESSITSKELRTINEDVSKLKKGTTITIPVVNDVVVVRKYVEGDPREVTKDGRNELYNEVHGLDSVESNSSVDVALVLDMSKTNDRNLEFVRGFLMGIDELKHKHYGINLRVFDVNKCTDNLIHKIDSVSSDLIISIEGNLRSELTSYGEEHNVEVVNVLDINDESYLSNPYVFQVLPPSTLFNDIVAEYFFKEMSDRQLVFISDKDDTEESFFSEHKKNLDSLKFDYIELEDAEELANLQLSDSKSYLFLPVSAKKSGIEKVVEKIIQFKEANPNIEFSVIGNPRWIMYLDSMQQEFLNMDTYIPSRFFFHKDSPDGKDFTERFQTMYQGETANGFPNFAVMGYDIAMYFVDGCGWNGGDFNYKLPKYDALQTDFKFNRVSNWGGYVNSASYIVRLNKNRIHKINL